MPAPPDITLLTREVLIATFVLSAIFGAIVRGTNFCTMGAISDVVAMGSWARMRQWALAAGVAMLGFAGLAAAGLIDPAASVYSGPRWMWLSALTGGAVFGVGMVLASGCGSKTLVRLGGGSLKALVVFMAMALAAYATLKGITAVLRAGTVDRVFVEFSTPASLGILGAAALQWPLARALPLAALLVAAPLIGWALAGRGFARPHHLLAGVGLGAVITGMWWTSGWLGFVAEHPETLEATYLATRSGRMEALTFTAPLAYAIEWLMLFSDRNQSAGIAVVSVAGVVAGAALHALATRQFRWEGFKTTEDLANHLVGGALMGVGGVTALGCTVGQGLSGVSTLSLTSFTAVAGIIAGAVLALKWQMWRLERTA